MKSIEDRAKMLGDQKEIHDQCRLAAKDVFGVDNPTVQMTDVVHEVTVGWDEEEDQQLALAQLKEVAKLCREEYGENPPKPESVMVIYQRYWADDDE